MTVSGDTLAARNSATAVSVACMIWSAGHQANTGTDPRYHKPSGGETATAAPRSSALSAADSTVPTQPFAIEMNLQYCLESAKMARAEQAGESRWTHVWLVGRRPVVAGPRSAVGGRQWPGLQPGGRVPCNLNTGGD